MENLTVINKTLDSTLNNEKKRTLSLKYNNEDE